MSRLEAEDPQCPAPPPGLEAVIVPRAHDDDAVARPREFGELGAAIGAGGDVEGLAASGEDGGGDFGAAGAAVDGAAEIDGVGEDQQVVGAHLVGERVDEDGAEDLERTVAMGLEEEQQAAGEGVEGLQRGGDLVGVVGEVVDDGDAASLADDLEAAL